MVRLSQFLEYPKADFRCLFGYIFEVFFSKQKLFLTEDVFFPLVFYRAITMKYSILKKHVNDEQDMKNLCEINHNLIIEF